MGYTAPNRVDMNSSDNTEVEITLTMSDATAARLVHAVRSKLPESAETPTIEQAVLMALTWVAVGRYTP